jgi:TetR/AcrR family transcriptional regulator, transcriptional repressor for nem operon
MNARAKQKAETRERILASAGARMKEHGIAGASVADVMGDLGLTVGGFYAHFGSKDDLIDQSLRRAMSERTQRLRDPAYPDQWQERLRRFASRYLTKGHRDDPAGGCPMPSVLADTGRLGAGRSALSAEVADLADVLRGELATGDPQARAATLATIATCVGALTLARALGKSGLSNEVLAAARAFVDQAVPHNPNNHIEQRTGEELSP